MTRRTTRLVLATMAVVSGALGGVATPARAQTAPCTVSPADQGIDAAEQQLLTLVNQYRVANGRSALSFSPDPTRSAAWFSRDMATKNYFPLDHIDSNGRGIPDRLAWCGVPWTAYAENIYAGSANAQDVFDLWRNSSVHNTNMLRDTVSLAGIARAFNAGTTYGWYWTLDFTAPQAPAISGSSWYSDGTNAKSGGAGTSVRAYAVGAFQNLPYQLVLATAGCSSTVAVLNATLRYATTSGFIPQTLGVVPSGLVAGSYVVCFRSTPDISSPTATSALTLALS